MPTSTHLDDATTLNNTLVLLPTHQSLREPRGSPRCHYLLLHFAWRGVYGVSLSTTPQSGASRSGCHDYSGIALRVTTRLIARLRWRQKTASHKRTLPTRAHMKK
ncbi:hypothetical protein CERZMDRAFT_91123 [Cercospora zeae-maydis SCOH1-5]|uniref:Uncharacterized protein n=1 Tax=Cercospora zeae-maydis SCOH1-5 TaxID=717836 RepID=A0A6A6FBH0_9PEZI|nr:hypothetical protein CERZMDRAFT_91123 [Cercospora zeae-maydis SCOH1-5]